MKRLILGLFAAGVLCAQTNGAPPVPPNVMMAHYTKPLCSVLPFPCQEGVIVMVSDEDSNAVAFLVTISYTKIGAGTRASSTLAVIRQSQDGSIAAFPIQGITDITVQVIPVTQYGDAVTVGPSN